MDRAFSVCEYGNAGRAWLDLARKSERISLRDLASRHVVGETSTAADHGATGWEATHNRCNNIDRLCTFVLAFSDYAYLRSDHPCIEAYVRNGLCLTVAIDLNTPL